MSEPQARFAQEGPGHSESVTTSLTGRVWITWILASLAVASHALPLGFAHWATGRGDIGWAAGGLFSISLPITAVLSIAALASAVAIIDRKTGCVAALVSIGVLLSVYLHF